MTPRHNDNRTGTQTVLDWLRPVWFALLISVLGFAATFTSTKDAVKSQGEDIKAQGVQIQELQRNSITPREWDLLNKRLDRIEGKIDASNHQPVSRH